MSPDTDELILMDPKTHKMLEGTQTNFFAVKDFKVVTAEEGILKGTMRDLLLSVCNDLQIPVDFTPPVLDDIDSWSAAFLTSTSRLALPIHTIVYHDSENQRIEKRFTTCPVIEKIMEAMAKEIERNCTKVFD